MGKKSCDSELFWLHLVKVESMESCSVWLETAFISQELCMKIFVMVADEPRHEKTCLWHMRTTKAQINLCCSLLDSIGEIR